MKIAFSGSRYIPTHYQQQAIAEIEKYKNSPVLVGDAKGLDALVRNTIKNAVVFYVEGHQKWHFATRSQRMIDAADRLIAFPLKNCPAKCTPQAPFSGHGSGTWGTIAYARKQGLPIEIIFLNRQMTDTPSWLTGEPLPTPKTGQLTLF